MEEIDVINIAGSSIHFILNTTLWSSFDSDVMSAISHPKLWKEVKLLAPDGKRNPQLATIPNDKGGIYLLLIKPNILPESLLYLMYIGRAPVEKKRPKIKRMIEQWGQYLYVRYFTINDNETIDVVESELIKKILPPCNDDIPDQKISAAVKAFKM